MISFYFVKMLADLAREQGSPNVIIAMRDTAINTIANGDGSQLITATLNGKTIGKKVYKDPATLAEECSLALDWYNNGPQGSFGIDYTTLGV